MFITATIDATLAAQNATIATESLGLGTVYIGAMRNQAEQVAKLYNCHPTSLRTFSQTSRNRSIVKWTRLFEKNLTSVWLSTDVEEPSARTAIER